MQGGPRPRPRATRQELRREVQWNAVEVDTREIPQADVDQRLQGERGEKVLAELAVCHPRLPFLEALEREGVDEHGRGPTKLDVERARILEHHPVLDRKLLDF